jgi:hypothetical protein
VNKRKENSGSKFSEIEIPESLDAVIDGAVERAFKDSKRMKGIKKYNNKFKIFKRTGIFAACIFLFIITVNISPAFAEYLYKIPGFETLITLVKYDKGLETAVNKGYAQKINKSIEDNGVVFSIDDIIFDKRSFIITYSIKTKDKFTNLVINDFKIIDKNGKKIQWACHRGLTDEYSNVNKGIIEIYLEDENSLPEDIIIKCTKIDGLLENHPSRKDIYGDWVVEFKIDKNKLSDSKPIVYELNKEIQLDKITFKVEDLKIHPTTMDVKFNMNNNDDYKYIGFNNIYIEDDKGNIYTSTGGRSLEKSIKITRFTSAYFNKVNSLTLKCDGVYIMPIKDQYVVVDLKNKKVIDDSGYGIKFKYERSNSEGLGYENGEKYDYCACLSLKKEYLNDVNIHPKFHLSDINYEKNMNYDLRIIPVEESYGEGDVECKVMLEFYDMKVKPDTIKLKINRIYEDCIDGFEIKLF